MGRGQQEIDAANSGLSRRGRGHQSPRNTRIETQLRDNDDVDKFTLDELKLASLKKVSAHIDVYGPDNVLQVIRTTFPRYSVFEYVDQLANFRSTGYEDTPWEYKKHRAAADGFLADQMEPHFTSRWQATVKGLNEEDYSPEVKQILLSREKEIWASCTQPFDKQLYELIGAHPEHLIQYIKEEMFHKKEAPFATSVLDYIRHRTEQWPSKAMSDYQEAPMKALIKEALDKQVNAYGVSDSTRKAITRYLLADDGVPKNITGKQESKLKTEMHNIVIQALPQRQRQSQAHKPFIHPHLKTFLSLQGEPAQAVINKLEAYNQFQQPDKGKVRVTMSCLNLPGNNEGLSEEETLVVHIAYAYNISIEQSVKYCAYLARMCEQ